MNQYSVTNTMTAACAAEGISCAFVNIALILDAILLASIFVSLLLFLQNHRRHSVFSSIPS